MATARPDWDRNIEQALKSLDEHERQCALIAEPAYQKYAVASYAAARKKYEAERNTYQKALDKGQVIIDSVVTLPFREAAGRRLSRFFRSIRDDGKILALRCSDCRRVIFPPRPVCGFCRITVGKTEDDWFSLKDTGTIISIVIPTEREVDRATGVIVGAPNPCAFIRLDGGDEWTVWVHYLERLPVETLRRGLRVQAVWKPRSQRRGRLTDIAYFRLLDEGKTS